MPNDMLMAMTNEMPGHTAKCRRCGRPLRLASSVSAQIGPRCAAIEAAFGGLNGKQRDKAQQLMVDGGIERVRKGTYRMPGEEGVIRVVSVNGDCTCEWGRHRASATAKTCYHVAVAKLFDKPRIRPAASQFILAA